LPVPSFFFMFLHDP